MGCAGKVASVKGRARCKVCGKRLTKEFSTVFTDGEDFNPNKINLEKQFWEQEEHVCNRCKSLTEHDIHVNKLISLLRSYHDIAEMVNEESNSLNLGNIVPMGVNDSFILNLVNVK